MPVSISRLISRDAPGAISAIQEAFKDDPYAPFVYSDSTKVRQAEAQSEILTDASGYYFLNIMVLVVKPGHQGKGSGKALAREVTEQADKEGKRCYVESGRDVPNIKVYESMGFYFVKTMDCDDEGTGIKLYCMVREPGKEEDREEEN